MSVISGNLADGKLMQVGGWYNGQQWDGSKLSAPGTLSSGAKVSNEVIAQTNPNNVAYVQQQQVKAADIQAPVSLNLPSANATGGTDGLQAQVDMYRKQLDTTLSTQKSAVDVKLADAKQKEQDTLAKEATLTTPFRADLEAAQREALHVNQNFEDNQKLVDELDSLLTQGNELLQQQQSVTGLASVRNPRIQQTMTDITARAGVIQAVISARNGQIAQAENMIDRSIGAITADRQDQLSYYNTVLTLNRQDIVSLDAESKKIADQQVALIKGDMDNAQATVDYVKKLLIDPATSALMGQAGVKVTDSVAQINGKLANAQYANEVSDMSNKVMLAGGRAVFDPSSVPAGQLITLTDSRGGVHYYQAQPGAFGTPAAKAGGGTAGVTANTNALINDVVAKKTLDVLMAKYKNTISPDTILSTYNKYSPWGQAKEDLATLQKKYNVTGGTSGALSQDLQDAQAAINAGADIEAVRKRFLQSHPSSNSAFNNYVQ